MKSPPRDPAVVAGSKSGKSAPGGDVFRGCGTARDAVAPRNVSLQPRLAFLSYNSDICISRFAICDNGGLNETA
jgi:hypothetical protein